MTTMVTAHWFKKHRIQLKLLRASPYVWFFALFLFEVIILRSLVWLQERATIDQFNQLPQIPGAQRLEYDTLLKEDFFNVTGSYATNKNLKETLAYFNAQFSQLGWQFGGDDYYYSETDTYYCKGDYTVSISFSNVAVRPWNYAINLYWGNSNHCQTTRGGARVLLASVPLLFLLGGSISWAIYAFIIGRATWMMDREEFELGVAKSG